MTANNATNLDSHSVSQPRAADDLAELRVKFADLTVTSARDDITKAWTNVQTYITSNAPRHLSESATNALFEDILLIMKYTQTTDPFLSKQQVRVFTLGYAVLNDVTCSVPPYTLASPPDTDSIPLDTQINSDPLLV